MNKMFKWFNSAVLFSYALNLGTDQKFRVMGVRVLVHWCSVPRNAKPLDDLFLRVFKHDGVFRHIFSFTLRQITMCSRISENGKPLDSSFLSVFEHVTMFKHLLSFMLRQVTMGPGFLKTENPLPNCSEQKLGPNSWYLEPGPGFRSQELGNPWWLASKWKKKHV